jgi:hypothetical protein
MALTKLALTLAAAAALGIMGAAYHLDAAPLSGSDLVTAQNDAPPATSGEDSAKMGKDEGTHTGPDLGATKEDDTNKIEQPERRNPTTGDGSSNGQ